jgi:hypothetical protein
VGQAGALEAADIITSMWAGVHKDVVADMPFISPSLRVRAVEGEDGPGTTWMLLSLPLVNVREEELVQASKEIGVNLKALVGLDISLRLYRKLESVLDSLRVRRRG